MDLYLTHLIFITVCAGGSYWYGYYNGQKQGEANLLYDLLDRGLVTSKQLIDNYKNITK
tara:strand:+ start:248 stop:424 length:177 start_codon:yes stop_codon:yes gene_type:complete